MSARKVCIVAAACGALTIEALAQASPEIDVLLARVAERIEMYYKRAQNIMCTEKTIVLPLSNNWQSAGMHRVTEAELRVEAEGLSDGSGPPGPTFFRQLLKINGREPREKDKKDRSACLDPNPLTPEPIAFLLPSRREGYTFTAKGSGKGKDARTLLIEYERRASKKAELIEDPQGREDCFDLSTPLSVKGRVVIDKDSYDVLRVEEHLAGLEELRTTRTQQRKYNFSPWITVDRIDVTTRYKIVSFKDPDETFLLPESIDTLEIYRGELLSHRTRQEFTNYRRFVTGGRLVK